MRVIVVLAVGLDSWLLSAQNAAWKSAGFVVVPVTSIKAGIDHFKAGDFDLVLLGRSLPNEVKERFTFMIRTSGSRTPVVCLSNSQNDCDRFADATLRGDPREFFSQMKELVRTTAGLPATAEAVYLDAV